MLTALQFARTTKKSDFLRIALYIYLEMLQHIRFEYLTQGWYLCLFRGWKQNILPFKFSEMLSVETFSEHTEMQTQKKQC